MARTILPMVALALAGATSAAAASISQARFDADAIRIATRYTPPASKGEVLRDEPAAASKRQAWIETPAAAIAEVHAYPAPKGYRYHTSARADLDRDGRPDLVQLVDNGREGAIRITYGDPRKAARLVQRGGRYLSGQGIYAAGRNAVLVQFPESSMVFVFERGGRVFGDFGGDEENE